MSRITQAISLAKTLHPTPLRTSNTTQLSNALENILHRAFPSEPSTSATSSTSGEANAGSSRKAITQHEERAVESMIEAVERIKAGQALKSYPLRNSTLKPRHDPHYYSRILEGVHRSVQGQGRSFWNRFFQRRGEA